MRIPKRPRFSRSLQAMRDPDSAPYGDLMTDDDGLRSELVERYPNNIRARTKVLKRSHGGGVKDAIVDLFLLSKCSKIYGSFPSSFSLSASLIGKVPFEYVRVDNWLDIITHKC